MTKASPLTHHRVRDALLAETPCGKGVVSTGAYPASLRVHMASGAFRLRYRTFVAAVEAAAVVLRLAKHHDTDVRAVFEAKAPASTTGTGSISYVTEPK